MKPDRVEFKIGSTRFKQPIRLVGDKGSDGVWGWTIYRDEGSQRDDTQSIAGLDVATIERMAEAVRSYKP